MILIAAENQELALLISINQRNPSHDPQTGRGTGYYLALTFGTLLSSQRADARKLRPERLRVRLDVQHYAGFQHHPQAMWSGGPPGPRGAWRTIHGSGVPLQGGPDRVRPGGDGGRLGNAGGPELHAHSGPDRLRRLGDAVLPGALAGATHDHEVAVAERESQTVAAADRPQHQRPRRAERDDGDHGVGGAPPADPVA